MTQKVVGVFGSEGEATNAITQLKDMGIKAEDISIVAKDTRRAASISEETGTNSSEGVAVGATAGGVLGGVTGLLAGLGALAIPGVGPLLAAGPIAAALTGAAIGAGAGGLAGGLIGVGVPETEAKEYDNQVNEGRILVLIDAEPEQMNDIYHVFHSNNSLNSQYFSRNDEAGQVGDQDVLGTHVSATDQGTLPWYNEKDVPADPEDTVSIAQNKEAELRRLHDEQVSRHR
ncbi:general stress protein [Paenibacillus tuaregi]|uniref:general stress protein n=1 Tax=Paenibacillus tuaregi TaxID=1816681 RepID=UPI00083961E0|nr:general stress protein [Paenibacillus tuaregi]